MNKIFWSAPWVTQKINIIDPNEIRYDDKEVTIVWNAKFLIMHVIDITSLAPISNIFID